MEQSKAQVELQAKLPGLEQQSTAEQQLEEDNTTTTTKLIIVTGFGPFKGHEDVNASWEAVQLLPDTLNFKGTKYLIEKLEVPVEYKAVDEAVEAIWARKPELVIHCGVHGDAKCVHVEKLAYNHKFTRKDYTGRRLPRASAKLRSDGIENDVIRCGLNVEKIVSAIADTCGCEPSISTSAMDGTVARASNDVGNYLCGYIYLKSLDHNKNRCLFVHVPPIEKPFSPPQTSQIVLKIIEECVRQIEEDIRDTCCVQN